MAAAAALEQNLKPKKRENRVGSDDNLKGGKRKSLKDHLQSIPQEAKKNF